MMNADGDSSVSRLTFIENFFATINFYKLLYINFKL